MSPAPSRYQSVFHRLLVHPFTLRLIHLHLKLHDCCPAKPTYWEQSGLSALPTDTLLCGQLVGIFWVWTTNPLIISRSLLYQLCHRCPTLVTTDWINYLQHKSMHSLEWLSHSHSVHHLNKSSSFNKTKQKQGITSAELNFFLQLHTWTSSVLIRCDDPQQPAALTSWITCVGCREALKTLKYSHHGLWLVCDLFLFKETP